MCMFQVMEDWSLLAVRRTRCANGSVAEVMLLVDSMRDTLTEGLTPKAKDLVEVFDSIYACQCTYDNLPGGKAV